MSERKKQLREFKRLLEEAAAKANHKNDLGVNLINNVSAEFEDYVALQKLNSKGSSRHGFLEWLNAMLVWPFKVSGLLNFGPPSSDPVTRNFINELGNRKDINRAQIRILNVYKMIRLEPMGIAPLKGWPGAIDETHLSLIFSASFMIMHNKYQKVPCQ